MTILETALAPYHPRGVTALFAALSAPCECERGKSRRTCQEHPLPFTGYRWYRDLVNYAPQQRVAA